MGDLALSVIFLLTGDGDRVLLTGDDARPSGELVLKAMGILTRLGELSSLCLTGGDAGGDRFKYSSTWLYVSSASPSFLSWSELVGRFISTYNYKIENRNI